MNPESKLAMLLLLRELTRVDCHDVLLRNCRNLEWLTERGDAEEHILTLIRYFDRQFGRTPNLETLQHIIEQTEKNEGMRVVLGEMKDLDSALMDPKDADYLIQQAVAEARQRLYSVIYTRAHRITTGAIEDKKRGTLSGPDDAREYVRKAYCYDIPSEYKEPVGLLHENTESVLSEVERAFQDEAQSRRLNTNIPALDKNVVIGFDDLRFIGIAGQSNHGKTMLLNSLCYQFLRTGKNVLYVSLEHKPINIWTKLAFLHTEFFQHDFKLPSYERWRMGQQAVPPVLQRDLLNLKSVIADIRDRGGLPGRLDVQGFGTWDEIEEHAKAHHKELQYDCIIVDYLEHLDLGDPRYADAAYKDLIKKASRLTKTFDNNRGIVLISPLPITKAAANGAGEFDPENPELPFGITAVRGASDIAYEMDLILGVHSDDALKIDYEALLFVLKKREGNHVPMTLCKVNRNNYLVTEKGAAAQAREEREDQAIQDLSGDGYFSWAEELGWAGTGS